MGLNIKPLADRVLIEPVAAETKTAGPNCGSFMNIFLFIIFKLYNISIINRP